MCKKSKYVINFNRLLLSIFILILIGSTSNLFAQVPCNQRAIGNVDFTYNGTGTTPARWDMSKINSNGFTIDQTAFAYVPTGNFSNVQTEVNSGYTQNTTRQYAIVKNPKDLNPQYADIPTDGMIVINPLQGQQDQFAQFQISGLNPNTEYDIEIKIYNVLNYTPTNSCCWNQMLKAETVGNGNNIHEGNAANGNSTGTNGNFSWDMGSNMIQNMFKPNSGGTYLILRGKKMLGGATTGFTITFSQGADGNYKENAFVFAIDYIKVYGCQTEAINVSGGSTNVCEGSDLILTAQGIGSSTSTYSWYQNGVLLPGRTSDTLNVVSPIGVGSTGTYKAVGDWSNQSVTLTSKMCCSTVGGTSDEVIRQSFNGLTYTCLSRPGGYADIPDKGTKNFIDAAYTYSGTACDGLNDGHYAVVQSSFAGDYWRGRPEVKDHTGLAGSGALFINAIGGVGQVFYKFSLNGLCNGTRYEFSAWYASLATGSETKPVIEFDVMNGATKVATTSTGVIPVNEQWYQADVTFVTPTTGNTTYTLQLINLVSASSGNDLMIDDIVVKKCTPFINLYPNGTKDTVLSVCNDNPVNLKVSTYYDLPLAITGSSTGTVYYQWMKSTSPNGPWTLLGAPETTGSYSATPVPTTYYYRAKVSSDYTRASTGLAPLASECGNDGMTTSFKLTKGGNFTIPPITGTTSYCPGNTMTLTGNSSTGTEWEWRKGATYSTATVISGYASSSDVTKKVFSKTFDISDISNYYFVVKDVNGCEAIAVDTIKKNPSPILTGTSTICRGTTTTLGATPAGGIWSSGTPTVATVDASGVVKGITAGTSMITYNSNGCADSVKVTVNAIPKITGTLNVLINKTTTLTGAPTGGTWSSASPTVATVDASGVVKGLATGTSVITYKLNGCDTSVTVKVSTVGPMNNDTILKFCKAANTTITGGGQNLTTWAWYKQGDVAPLTGTSNAADKIKTISETSSVVWYFRGFNGSDFADQKFTITINPLPTITSSSVTICAGLTVTITASGGTSYKWSNSQSTPSITVNPTSTITYTVTGTDANTCSNTSESVVTVNPKPVVSISPLNGLCKDASPITLTEGSPTGGTYSGTGVTGNTFSPSVAGKGVFVISYIYTVSATGCSDTAKGNITVYDLPKVDLGSDKIICAGDSVTITATSQATGTYKWNDGSPGNIYKDKPAILTTYTVTLTDNSGCSGSDQIVVTVSPIPVVNFSASSLLGCSPLSVTFTDKTTPLSANNAYSWNFGDTNSTSNTSSGSMPTHIYKNKGNYNVSLQVTTGDKCANDTVFNNLIKVNSSPIANFTYSPPNPSNFDPQVTFTDLSKGDVHQWLWNFNDQASTDNISNDQNPVHDFSTARHFHVNLFVSDDNGCKDSIIKDVYVMAVYTFYSPNAFTPNDDGINDGFRGVGLGIDEKSYEFYVFDRWGELIFKTNDLNDSWNGKAQKGSTICSLGIYSWMVRFNDLEGKNHEYIGKVVLMR